MSDGKGDEAYNISCCASCGIAEIDDIKLKDCDGCDLVRYCSDECKENHKTEHEEDCKKRTAELRDELLFKQPESTHRGDCPICCLPLSLDYMKSGMMACCWKLVCNGCFYAITRRELEMRLKGTCPFCRELTAKTKEEISKRRMKRMAANDPVAMCQEGEVKYEEGDYSGAFQCHRKAAELGDVEAHNRLADMYYHGRGVEKDGGKYVHHLEEAAIGGHPHARHNLGAYEWDNNKNYGRAVKHWIISATQGHDYSIKMLLNEFRNGFIEKDVLAAALRAHKAAADAAKSPQRDEAEKAEYVV